MKRRRHLNIGSELVTSTGKVEVDYEKAKDLILEELYYSVEFKSKVRGYVFRNYPSHLGKLDDIFQEVMLEMTKKSAEYLFNEYVKKPGSIIALALTIAKMFFKINTKYPDYPGKSIIHRLKYHSSGSWNTEEVVPTDSLTENESGELSGKEIVLEDDSYKELEGFRSNKSKYIDLIDELINELSVKEERELISVLKKLNKLKTTNSSSATYNEILRKHKVLLSKLKVILKDDRSLYSINDVLNLGEQNEFK